MTDSAERLTLTALLDDVVARHGERVALVCGDEQLTFEQLRERSQRLATSLQARGIGAGDAVAVWLSNGFAWHELQFATARLGARAVAINTRFKSHEVGDLLSRSGARLLVCDRASAQPVLDEIEPARRSAVRDIIDVRIDHPRLLLAPPLREDHATPEAISNVFTSSGTTSAPKLVAHCQRAAVIHARAVATAFGYDQPGCVVLGMLPYCGVFGFDTALAALAGGARLILLPVFDAAEARRLVRVHGVTHANGGDDMFRRILASDGDASDLATLRSGGYAEFQGDGLPLVDEAAKSGIALFGLYGSSEVQALVARRDEHAPVAERAVAGGTPTHPDTEVRVCDPETGAALALGETGEIQLRGPSLTVGYLGNDAATAAAFTDDGFFRTGDLGVMTGARQFTYIGRRSDAMRLSGFLVSPAEIETFLEKLPNVRLAQVVGVRVAGGGERAFAFVLPHERSAFDEDALKQQCAAALARFKVPYRIVAVESFPTTPSANGEKIQRVELRKKAQELIDG